MPKKFRQVFCKRTGNRGWQARVQDVYNTLEIWQHYCEIYTHHKVHGFKTPESEWKANPMIEGSVNPGDRRRVPEKELPKSYQKNYGKKHHGSSPSRMPKSILVNSRRSIRASKRWPDTRPTIDL
jgi:hypothetical protein